MSNLNKHEGFLGPETERPLSVTGLPKANSSAIVEMDPLVAMIERSARDPSIDLDRLERLITMKERSERLRAEGEFNEAMAKIHWEIAPVARDSHNPQTHSKYASYFAVDKATRPILGKYGIGVAWDESTDSPEGYIRVKAFVYKGTHTKEFHYDSPILTTGAKGHVNMTITHAKAAAVTYAKRYLMGMIFNLSTGEDTDGNVVPQEVITSEQLLKLEALATSVHADMTAFCKVLNVADLHQLPQQQYPSAMALLKAKRAATTTGGIND